MENCCIGCGVLCVAAIIVAVVAVLITCNKKDIKEKLDSISSSLENSTVTKTKTTEVFESDKWVGKERKTTIVKTGEKQKPLLFNEGISLGMEKYINENLQKILEKKISANSDNIKKMLENKIDKLIEEQKNV